MTVSKILLPAILLLAAGFVLTSGAARLAKKEVITQPIQFNHFIHVDTLEMACTDCHPHVMEREFAGRPTLKICAECHDISLTDSPEEVILLEYVQSQKEIPWRRLYEVPGHVFYSHRRHTTVAGIDCMECHGEIGLSTTPPPGPLTNLSMKFCMDCHEKKGVTTDCNACHR